MAPLTAPAAPLPEGLDPALAGARIQRVRQPDALTVLLETHRSGVGAAHWVICVEADTARLGRTFHPGRHRGRQRGPAPVFCQWLRSRLEGARVEAVGLRHPQLLELAVTRGGGEGAERPAQEPQTHRLVLELNRRDSNLLLLDAAGRLLIALRHPSLPGRRLSPGEPYAPPPKLHPWPRGVPLAERYPAPDEAGAREREARWTEREREAALEARRRPALRHLRRELKRLRRRLEHLGEDRAAAGEAELWRRRGELLQIHRAALHPGQAEVTVPDVFADGQPPVTIPLDPRADPAENIERCFRRYRKRRDAGPHVDERVAQTERAIAAAETLRERLEAADSPAAVAELAGALPGASRELRAQVRGEPPPGAAAAGGQAAGPLRRRSADGYEILVGRSGAENDRVTFRLGRGRDWWLHAQGIPGSHVLVVNPAGGALPPRTLREAAWLAGHYSRARASGHAEVDYTQRKHVRRQKGGDPGQVTYTQNKTLRVALDDPELAQVLERTVDEAS